MDKISHAMNHLKTAQTEARNQVDNYIMEQIDKIIFDVEDTGFDATETVELSLVHLLVRLGEYVGQSEMQTKLEKSFKVVIRDYEFPL